MSGIRLFLVSGRRASEGETGDCFEAVEAGRRDFKGATFVQEDEREGGREEGAL